MNERDRKIADGMRKIAEADVHIAMSDCPLAGIHMNVEDSRVPPPVHGTPMARRRALLIRAHTNRAERRVHAPRSGWRATR
jgi:hypothetical protein